LVKKAIKGKVKASIKKEEEKSVNPMLLLLPNAIMFKFLQTSNLCAIINLAHFTPLVTRSLNDMKTNLELVFIQ